MKKLFGETRMSWAKVLLLAVVSAVITSVLLIVPSLKGTSFQDPGTYLECWFFLAIIIIVNCKKWWEASLKCFVFFLVSQPLIYLIQVPFNAHGWGIFQYYKTWFILTILTLPGAIVAYQLKRKNGLSVAILAVPLLYWAGASTSYLVWAIRRPINHLLSSLLCIAFGIACSVYLFNKAKYKKASLIIFGLAWAAWLVLSIMDHGILI